MHEPETPGTMFSSPSQETCFCLIWRKIISTTDLPPEPLSLAYLIVLPECRSIILHVCPKALKLSRVNNFDMLFLTMGSFRYSRCLLQTQPQSREN